VSEHLPDQHRGAGPIQSYGEVGQTYGVPSRSPRRRPPHPDDEIGLDDLLRFTRRQWWVILLTFVVVVAGTAIYSWMTTPVWESSALIRVGAEGSVPAATLFPDLAGNSDLETEMLVVETRPVLYTVVQFLSLNFELRHPPDVPRHFLFSHVDFDRSTPEVDYEIVRLGVDRYDLRSLGDAIEPLELQFEAGDTVVIRGGTFALHAEAEMRDRGVERVPERLEVSTLEFERTVTRLQEDLSVTRPDRVASLFRVAYQGRDRWLVRNLVREVAQSFIDQRRGVQKTRSVSTVDFLEARTAEFLAQLVAAEDALQAFREENQVVALGPEAEEQVRMLAGWRAERAGLVAERDALRDLLLGIGPSGDQRTDFARLIAYPTFLANPTFQNQVEVLTEAERRRTELRSQRTEFHPDMVALDLQIAQIQERLAFVGRGYLSSLNERIAGLDAILVRFGNELAEIPARELQFARLERECTLLAAMYSFLQQRLEEARVTAEVEDPSVWVVEDAVLGQEPVRPRKLVNMALASVLGLMLGLGLGFLRQAVDRRLTSDDDVGELLGAPILTRVPRLPATAANGPRPATLITHHQGSSVPAEAYRNLRSSIFFAGLDTTLRKDLVVTSPGPRDGKSVTASNLAITFAQQKLKTLLIDADLRRSALHETFEAEQSPGLSEYLQGIVPLDSTVVMTKVPRLLLIPAGRVPPNPAELLGSDRMDTMLRLLRRYFEAIVVDSPPVLAVTDAAVLAHKVGNALLVVRPGQTHRHAADEAISRLRMVGARVHGVVVNDSDGGASYGYAQTYYGARP
jgi:tyrosine-protein kinase Etk/Wzc